MRFRFAQGGRLESGYVYVHLKRLLSTAEVNCDSLC